METFCIPHRTVAILQRPNALVFINQISTNVDQNRRSGCARSRAGEVEDVGSQPMICRRRQLVCQ